MKDKIKGIKQDIKKLLILFDAIREVFPSNQNTLISVMLQNMAHDASHCVNYMGDKAEWERMNTIKKAIEAFQTYHDYHLIGFVVEEISMSFMGNEQVEPEISDYRDNIDYELG